MSGKTLFFCLTLLGQVLSLSAQNIRIPLNERLVDDKINKSLAILPVYKYESLQIEPYTMFGVEKRADVENLVIRKMPPMQGMIDTGYTYVYFSGANTNINQGYCLTIIGNYSRTRRTIYFFIDRNNNLDFTDDGKPDSLTSMHNQTIFKIRNQQNEDAEHWVQISRIEYSTNIKYKLLLTDHFAKHSGTKKFTDVNFCYREQRLNTKGGSYREGSDSFVIAVKDMNNNGIFNENCIDKIYIGSVHDQVNTDEMNYIYPKLEDVYFEWNKKRYQLVNIDPAGSFVEIRLSPTQELNKKLEVGKKIPKFTFINIKNQKEDIKSYKGMDTYIFFWDKEKITKEDTMFLRLMFEEFSDRIQIISLNHGDAPKSVRIIQYYDKVKWPMAFSSYQIGKMFFVEDLPRGYLIDKKLRLVENDLSPQKAYEMLNGL